ncbi:hypothetical protein M430DRAFT_177542 [Amorphotheca resinae ATCC 22711]|uniref:Secreted protein n=1 Tax=Amorphotheca resinae ATCC 22711 TaxID=857342 RepID=A0A2T3AT70_AMORE|nr:hypothetical protein M430DRAFT_177542 [Amorphotheca resinae ATCC 22711]PSS10663.1 hypothetical protein M430DRAFT_177542 [Amorphotheca resinae ATCC 22711]
MQFFLSLCFSFSVRCQGSERVQITTSFRCQPCRRRRRVAVPALHERDANRSSQIFQPISLIRFLPCGVRAARQTPFLLNPWKSDGFSIFPTARLRPRRRPLFLPTMDQRYRKLSIVPRILVRKRGS